MFLHLGENVVVREEDVVGIFDIENTSIDKDTRIFLKKAQENGEVVNVSLEMPKSFCVCQNPITKEKKVYISQISPQTLLKRQQSGFDAFLSKEKEL